jgi:hypothetical protein
MEESKEIYDLMDEILAQLSKKSIHRNEMFEGSDDNRRAFLILIGYGYLSEGTNIAVTPSGHAFIATGGFKAIAEKERLMNENIQASIDMKGIQERMLTFQRKATKYTIGVAAVTLLVLIVQVLLACFGSCGR